MWKILVFIITLVVSCSGNDKYEDLMEMLSKIRPRQNVRSETAKSTETDDRGVIHKIDDFERPKTPHSNNSFFCDIEQTDQSLATEVKEKDYPWIARLLHSVDGYAPLICTAAAVADRVFITAAVCLYTSKVRFSSVLYQKLRLRPKAFVVPTNTTKQLFDDIGLVIVHRAPYPDWKPIKLIDAPRTDEHFGWFEDLHLGFSTNRVLGFVHPFGAPDQHHLYALDGIFVSNFLCNKITGMNAGPNNYWVPCYHHCTVKQHFSKSKMCEPYLVGVGHVVLDKNSVLIGVATWACSIHSSRYTYQKRLPIGIAVPNSKTYYEDFACAIKIRDFPGTDFKPGYYKKLCAEKR